MMPVMLFQEPSIFDTTVRQRGLRFLQTTPEPDTQTWNKHAYWQAILPAMSELYKRICNYCSTWIPHSTGQHSIDHFLDKVGNPMLAYEWENYRYVSARFNSRKGVKRIVDPANLPLETFVLNFNNFFVEVNPVVIEKVISTLASETIKILKLNEDDELVTERMTYFFEYKNCDISFSYLQKQAPFIAYEINRQGLRTH
ncbi:MAG: hypothetical protein JNJ90_08640 [Saprospiraceae bacterium]|jgi:hypothetical protein|nr:hypothetical protein [Saprospiraceae bacterium]